MLAGIILVLAGILIAVFPQLLSLIVSAMLILAGLLVLAAAYNERKMDREYGNPVIELFLRF